ncbi:MAG: YdeI/OmpD-associated family protein [Longimicrobiales bacterium]|nr:YdeI/OmpD-associated family protein [Longimicrobiales bacterium]
MAERDPRIDAYIEKSADFAQPVLRHLREVVYAGCPEARETMKWSFPHFEYKGILCSMASFKAHCAFNFWSGAEVLEDAVREGAMGQLGRITSLKDLPSKKVLVGYVKKAVALKDAGVKPAWAAARAAKAKRPEPPVPEELAAALALKKNKKAKEAFDAFTPGHRREYIEHIVEAKRPETRARRVAKTVEALLAAKPLNWKYS